MKNIQLYEVAPCIPERIQFLEELAKNLWWCWNLDAMDLFGRIDPDLWRRTRLNPLQLLMQIPQERLAELAEDEAFITHLDQVRKRFKESTAPSAHGTGKHGEPCIAYFSLEYGLHESVRCYAGGLGVLAGDHLKAASDLRLPLAGVGLLYQHGYFRQYLDVHGVQQEDYPDSLMQLLPLSECLDESGKQIQVHVPMPEGTLAAAVWRLDVGCVPLYLLDTNLAENPPLLRETTARLYGGDSRTRLRQELLLGIGGIRALHALGIDPHVCHLNEGHAAFLSLARISHLSKKHHLDLDTAMSVVAKTNVFTTHTPVPAGNETFPLDLMEPYLRKLEPELGISVDQIVTWCRPDVNGEHHDPSMTVLGLRATQRCNGVSRLHGQVARRMWSHLWPERPVEEVPIGHVTNGVHVQSWLSAEIIHMLDRYVGPQWRTHPAAPEVLERVERMPDAELWHNHEVARSRLVRVVRDHVEQQYRARHVVQRDIDEVRSLLNHDTLTIGFARRFATYKRATLLFQDVERLEALLGNEDRPLQIVFAGKAHPHDQFGKDFIRRIVDFTRTSHVGKRVIFVENYDMHLARRMVQGVDVWLNTPRRPQEASGTSGMKAALNGVLNASVLDGWWCEGYHPDCGWAIGNEEVHEDESYQDAVEAHALYNLLENEIVPLFYDRASGELPQQWIRMMKAAIRMVLRFFTSHRMVAEYRDRFYLPSGEDYENLTRDEAALARRLSELRKRLRDNWGGVHVEFPTVDADISALHVGDTFGVSAVVHLGSIAPAEVNVQVFYGPVNSQNEIEEIHVENMELTNAEEGGRCMYHCPLTCGRTGRYGFTVRAMPAESALSADMPGLMSWAEIVS